MTARTSSLREKFKKNLQQKTQESYQSKDSSGGGFRNYFDKSKTTDVKFFRIPKGDCSVLFDIIPYEAGKQDPKNKEGEAVYLLDVDVHRNIGAANEQVLCLTQYNLHCPICEEITMRKANNEDYESRIKPLKATRRVVYNIIVRDGGPEEKKGVQVYEVAHFLSEKNIVGISKNPRTGGTIVFSDPDSGRSISFSKRSPSQGTVIYDSFQFCDRPAPITEEELNAAITLDELLEMREYDDISALLLKGTSDNDNDNDNEGDGESAKTSDGWVEPGGGRTEKAHTETPDPPARSKRRERVAQQGPVCPHGGTIGKDIDELDACPECEMYDQCETVADSM